jgi:hypothetical protein
MIYEPMHMHLHTCHQPGGSMEGHIYNASLLGMRYIRFTDHDTRTGRKSNPIEEFDFTLGEAVISDKRGKYGFEFFGEPSVSLTDGKMKITHSCDNAEYHKAGAYFVSSGTKHTSTLIAEVTVTLGMRVKTVGDARIYLDVRLSQRPPEHKAAHLIYSFGNYPEEGQNTVRLPISEAEDGVYKLCLSDDMRDRWEIGGLDNVFDTLLITAETRNGGYAEIEIDSFKIDAKYGYDDVIVRQRAVADIIGKKYGVKPFVTTEISGAGQHKNVFSTAVPVINYEELGYKVTAREAVDHVKKYGGIFAYNHPFENDKYKKMRDLTRDEVELAVVNEAASLISKRLYGATLMEVGFTEGRGLFTLADHLRLWDIISLSGIFITGYGDSDSHKNHQSWFEGNNFATWIAVDEKLPYPAPEEEFIKSMKAGNVYMGDPVFLKSPLSFTSEDSPMGSVVFPREKTVKMSFKMKTPPPESTVRIIVEGRSFIEEKIGACEDYSLDYEFEPEFSVSFSRVELYNKDGRCIMLTNPIYVVDREEFRGDIPKERINEVK